MKLSRSVTFVVVTGNLRMPESRLLRRVDAEERDERERTAVKRVEIMFRSKEWVGTRTKKIQYYYPKTNVGRRNACRLEEEVENEEIFNSYMCHH